LEILRRVGLGGLNEPEPIGNGLISFDHHQNGTSARSAKTSREELYVSDYYQGKIYQIRQADKAWMPVFEAEYVYASSNAFAYSNTVNVTCATPNATVHYTTTGIDPIESDAVVPVSGYIPIVDGTTYKAKAFGVT